MPKVLENISTDVIAILKALSEPLRLEVVELLREQEMCVCDLCDRLDVTQSKLSFHLKTLRTAGIVRSRQEGRWIYYRLNLSKLVELEEYLAEFRRYSPRLPARICPPENWKITFIDAFSMKFVPPSDSVWKTGLFHSCRNQLPIDDFISIGKGSTVPNFTKILWV